MKAVLELPLRFIIGKIFGLCGHFYARIQGGKQIIQRCPRFTKPHTPAQQAAIDNFRRRYCYQGHPYWGRKSEPSTSVPVR